CPHCRGLIAPEQKRELNNQGIWLREGERAAADGSITGTPRNSRIASFWMEGTFLTCLYVLVSIHSLFNEL
ncbi:phage terminase large subunit family protein, partial [Escherichia coli]